MFFRTPLIPLFTTSKETKRPQRRPQPGLYVITCTVNNRVYIGQSTHVTARLNAHKSKLRRHIHENPALNLDYQTYGEKGFTFAKYPLEYPRIPAAVQADGSSAITEFARDFLKQKEREMVEIYPPDLLYNVHTGASAFIKENNNFYRHEHTIDARYAQGAARRGQKSPFAAKEQSELVKEFLAFRNSQNRGGRAVCVNGVRYESISEAERQTGYSRRKIRDYCNQLDHPRFQWAEDSKVLGVDGPQTLDQYRKWKTERQGE